MSRVRKAEGYRAEVLPEAPLRGSLGFQLFGG